MRNKLTFGVSFVLISLASSSNSWGENINNKPILTNLDAQQDLIANESMTVPLNEGQTLSDIQVIFVDKDEQPVTGKTKPEIILREFKLKPGDIYNPELAKEGLERVNNLIIVKQATVELESSATDNDVIMVVKVEESSSFFFSFGLTLNPPTALQGVARPATVIPMSDKANGIGGGIRFGVINLGGTNKALTLGIEGGENTLGFDLDYRDFWGNRRGIGANLTFRQGVEPEFDNGETEVNLPNGDNPWISRIGGGVEYFFPLAKDFQGALGVSYRLVSARDGLFSSSVEPVDEFGNPLTISDDGEDTLLTLNFASALDRRNNRSNPTQGYRLLFATDQSIPVGNASIFSNRLSANYTHFLPFNFFGFTEGDRTLVFNVQGGTVIGDLPPYDGFSLGGPGSVRGYTGGELGTGRSFLQATLEYRFPVVNFNAFKEELNLGASLFVDYGTNLGSEDTITGIPGEARDKPGSGLGYGLGLRLPTDFGTLRLEFALNDEGGSAVYFNIGERF